MVMTCSFVYPGEEKWVSAPEKSLVGFTANGPFGKVNGTFGGIKAPVIFDEHNLSASSITASVEVNTIATGISLRDKDLREKEEWFNVSKFPQITIVSNQIEKIGTGYKLIAVLTMKGVSKTMDIPFMFFPNGTRGLLKSTFKINREDFGIGSSGGVVGKEVTIRVELPVKRAQ